MDSPAILKAPLLLVAIYCCRICVKPPNPAASIEERTTFANRGNTRDVLGVIWPATLFRRTFYVIDLIELAVVLSSVLPFGKWTETFQASRIYISPSFILSLTMMCAGTVIRSAAYRHLGRYFTFELSIKKDHKLITDGPYSIVRHPSYLGSVLFYSGACLSQLFCRGSWFIESGMWGSVVGKLFGLSYSSLGLFIAYFLVSRIPKEDMVMRQEFKEEWVAWAKRTQYRLIPFVY